MTTATLYVGNSNVVELQSLTNSVTGLADTGATVTVTLYDMAGVEVSGQVWPAPMAHVADGLYRATLDDGVGVTKGYPYVLIIEAAGSGGETGHWEIKAIAQTRGGC